MSTGRAPEGAFSRTYTATADHIDELGHVNNAVWVQWIQDLAVSHWRAVADPEHVEAYFWVVTRHEIDYRGNIGPGETATGRTWISEPPRGARFNRNIEFVDASGKPLVQAVTTWAMLEKASGRPARVLPEMVERFMGA